MTCFIRPARLRPAPLAAGREHLPYRRFFTAGPTTRTVTAWVFALAALVGFVGPAYAQGLVPRMQSVKNISIGLGEQIPEGFVGVGARGMGMGGAQIASATDGTALFWNPAALTEVRRIELLGALTLGRPEASSEVGFSAQSGLTTTSASASVTSLNALILTAPYPTYRGGLTFAFGVTRPNDYTFRARRDGLVGLGGASYFQSDEVRQNGGVSQYAMGMGVEVSPTVSLGFAVVWYHGGVKLTRNLALLAQIGVPPDSLTGTYRQNNSINGVSATVGTTVRLPLGFGIGAVAIPPVTYEFAGTWSDEYVEAIGANIYTYPPVSNKLDYKIRSPWQLGLGLTWATYAISLNADLWYTDWQQARFDGNPYGSGSGIDAERFFEDRYRQTVRWHVGGEVLVPWIGTYLRAGYYRNPDPFRGPTLDTGERLSYRNTGSYYTFGAGWLIEETLTADVAYVHGGNRYSTGELTEKRNARRVFFTLAFRL